MHRTKAQLRRYLSNLERENEQLRREKNTLRIQLIAALTKLCRKKRDPQLSKKILQMRTEGLSYRIIQARTGLSYDAVRGRCRYALQKKGVAKKTI